MPVDLDALARGEPGDRRPSSPGGDRRGCRSCRPAGRRCRCTTKPSSVASISAPSPRSPSTTPAIRSDSLTRSSWAPRTSVSPSAKQPSSATSGSSSIASGTSLGLHDRPLEGAVGDVEVAHRLLGGELLGSSSRSPRTIPRIRRRIRMKPVRVQLTPTSASSSREPGTSTPAAIRNAAELGSPGTAHRVELQLVGVDRRHVAAVAVDRDAGRAAASARCGRGCGSARRRSWRRRRRARRAARTTSPARWRRRARRRSTAGAAPRIVSGAKRPSRASSSAPICRSGAAIRSTGRRRIDSSPSSVNERPCCAASQPGSSRSSVPALPTSIGWPGLARLAQAGAADHDVAAVLLDERAERAHRVERRGRVGGVQVVRDPHRLRGHRAEQRGAMGDRLVGRRRDGPGEAPCGLEANVHARRIMLARRGSRGRPRAPAPARPAPRRRPTARPRPGCCRARATAPGRRC